MSDLKLYVWRNVESLRDYYEGLGFAYAESKEQAIELICAQYDKYVMYESHGTLDEIRAELTATEPLVPDKPTGFMIVGYS